MKFGKDDQDTHQSMQLNRRLNKYETNQKRHVGRNRRKHLSDGNKPKGHPTE